jgi:hypothetical protein
LEAITNSIRVNVTTGELELSGSQEFIEGYADRIDAVLMMLADRAEKAPLSSPSDSPRHPTGPQHKLNPEGLHATFGEYLHTLRNGITGTDQILAAGHFAQQHNSSNQFTTRDANKLLTDQGIKLANPTQSVTNNVTGKRAIKLSKGAFRVSPDGIKHLQSLRA